MSDNDSEHLLRPGLTRLDVFGRYESAAAASVSDNSSVGCRPPSTAPSSHPSSNDASLHDYDILDDNFEEVPPGKCLLSRNTQCRMQPVLGI